MLLRTGHIHVALASFELGLTSDNTAIYHPRGWDEVKSVHKHLFSHARKRNAEP